MKNIIYIIGIISGLTFCLSSVFMSCSSDDFNTKELIAYFPVGQKNTDVVPFNLLKVKNGITSNFNLPINLTRPVDKDIYVTASINNDLLEVYNSKYAPEVPIEEFPSGLFSLEGNGKTMIPAGKTSSDPLLINIGNLDLIDNSKLYVIPIEIELIDKGIPISANRSVMFAEINMVEAVLGISTSDNLNDKHITLNSVKGDVQNYEPLVINANLSNSLGYASKVEVRINNDLISLYNEQNNKNYIPFPAGSYELQNSKTEIPAFSQSLKAPIQISYDPKKLKTFTQYILPIELVDIDEKGQPFINKNRTVVYFSLNKFENYIDSESTIIEGEKMDRSGWKLSSTTSSARLLANLIDGNDGTCWEGDWRDSNFTIDMGTKKEVNGFVLSRYNGPGSIKGFDLYVSDDSENWIHIGTYLNEELSDRIVNFTSPIGGRYFKFRNFRIVNMMDWYPRIAEINAYQ